jgi:3-oxoacyl-[acyl-carrier protein] reductase
MDFSGQHILLTGAAGSIGSALAMYFANHNALVTAVDIDEKNLFSLAEKHASIAPLVVDLVNPNTIEEAFKHNVLNKLPYSCLINNAGLIHSELLFNFLDRSNPLHNLDAWKSTIDSNLNTTFYTSRWMASYFVEKRIKGSIINFSSISAQGNLGQTAYAAAKAGVEAMTKVWAKELGRFGIRVNALAPGFIDTPSTHNALNDQKLNVLKKETPLGRLGTVDELCEAVTFLISNSFINGQILGIDGGLTVHS